MSDSGETVQLTSGKMRPDEESFRRGELLPEKVITVNMLVAYNMARWRQAADLTQGQLGEQLGGWTNVAVSAAERSWDGKRVRKFDADEIVNLASAFNLPLAAMFMPPPDDGVSVRYLIRDDSGGEPVPIGEFFQAVLAEPVWEDERPVAAAYLEAFTAALGRYADGPGRLALAQAMADNPLADLTRILLKAQDNARNLSGLYAVIDDALDGNAVLRQTLERALRATSGTDYPPPAEPEDSALSDPSHGIVMSDLWEQLPTREKERAVTQARQLRENGTPGPYTVIRYEGRTVVMTVADLNFESRGR